MIVLAVSGVQLAEFAQTNWNFVQREALQVSGSVSCALLRGTRTAPVSQRR